MRLMFGLGLGDRGEWFEIFTSILGLGDLGEWSIYCGLVPS